MGRRGHAPRYMYRDARFEITGVFEPLTKLALPASRLPHDEEQPVVRVQGTAVHDASDFPLSMYPLVFPSLQKSTRMRRKGKCVRRNNSRLFWRLSVVKTASTRDGSQVIGKPITCPPHRPVGARYWRASLPTSASERHRYGG